MDQEDFFTSAVADHFTIRDIARRIGATTAEVKATIDRLRIYPARRVGVVRLWTESELREVERAIRGPAAEPQGARRSAVVD